MMRWVVAMTGASGSIYGQRLLKCLVESEGEVHVVLSSHAREVAIEETGGLAIPDRCVVHDNRSMQVPFVSGSSRFDAMVIIPCSMGTLGRIAYGFSDSTITRAADVFLKERRTLILVPREMPWNLVHARNVVRVMEAGAKVFPACPSFYCRPRCLEDLVDTVVARVLDHLGVQHQLATRWKEAPDRDALPDWAGKKGLV